ncbi:pfkB carbohydrate kinase family protein, partial [Vibrio parahaemolyticus V-223/04]
RSTCRY